MTRFITLAGKKQSGKDTSAIFIRQLLISDSFQYHIDDKGEIQIINSVGHGPLDPLGDTRIHIVHFADALKQACHTIFGIPLKDMATEEGKQKLTHILWPNNDGFNCGWFPHPGIEYVSSTQQPPYMTVREVLQFVGTDLFREQMYANVWVESIFRYPWEDRDIVIIADARFPNEVEFACQHGLLIKIERDTNLKSDSHKSETALDDYKGYDHIVQNNSSLDDLRDALYTILQIHGLIV